MVPVEVVKQQYLESGSALNDIVDEEMNQEAAICAANLEQCRHQFDGAVVGDELTPRVFGEDTPDDVGYEISKAAQRADPKSTAGSDRAGNLTVDGVG